MLRQIAVLAFAAAMSTPVWADDSWPPVTVTGFKADPVRVFGPNCKGGTEETLSKGDVGNIAEAKLKPTGGCVQLRMKDGSGPKFVAERMLDIPNKPVRAITCPPGIVMSERDKTSNTSMGYGSDCVPATTPAAP